MLVHEINAIYFDPKLRKSIVLSNDRITLDIKPIDYIESLCNRYGLSLLGSFTAIKRSLNIHQKCPILVHPLLQIYFFQLLQCMMRLVFGLTQNKLKR